MDQFYVPHYKWVQGRLIPLGRRPVGRAEQTAAPEGTGRPGWQFAAVRFEQLREQESGRLIDVSVIKTAAPERHIRIWITDRPGERRR